MWDCSRRNSGSRNLQHHQAALLRPMARKKAVFGGLCIALKGLLSASFVAGQNQALASGFNRPESQSCVGHMCARACVCRAIRMWTWGEAIAISIVVGGYSLPAGCNGQKVLPRGPCSDLGTNERSWIGDAPTHFLVDVLSRVLHPDQRLPLGDEPIS